MTSLGTLAAAIVAVLLVLAVIVLVVALGPEFAWSGIVL